MKNCNMKIAVFHNLPSGGARRALYNAVKYLSDSGHDLCLTIPETANEGFLDLGNFCNEIKIFPMVFNFFDVPNFFISHSLINPFLITSKSIRRLIASDRCQREIAGFINEANFDIVFSDQCGFSYSPFLFRYLTIPSVFFCQQPRRSHEAILNRLTQIRNGNMESASQNSIKPRYDRKDMKLLQLEIKNASFASLILANSFYSRETILRQLGLNSSVCYLGIDTKNFRSLFEQRENFILSVGAIYPAKGFDFIISSVSRINIKIRPKVVLVGNVCMETEKTYLTELARKKCVDLEIKIMVSENELIDLYNRAKIFTYAPYLEPFGLTPLEAMACGTPVVAVKEGGVRETVIDNVTGFLVDRDEDEFSKAIECLLTDNELRTMMGTKGIEEIQQRWTLEASGDRLLSHLNRVVENKNQP